MQRRGERSGRAPGGGAGRPAGRGAQAARPTRSCASSCSSCSASGPVGAGPHPAQGRGRAGPAGPADGADLREALACELVRAEVFAGKRTPLLFGEPAEWMALLRARRCGSTRRASSRRRRRLRDTRLRRRARHGGQDRRQSRSTGSPTRDSRLGPMLRSDHQRRRYYWMPFARLRRIEIEKPPDLRDLVWMPAHAHPRQRRRDGGADPDPLPGLRAERRHRIWHGAQAPSGPSETRDTHRRARPAHARHRAGRIRRCWTSRTIELAEAEPEALATRRWLSCTEGAAAAVAARPADRRRARPAAGVARQAGAVAGAPARERAARPELAVQHARTWRPMQDLERLPRGRALGGELRHARSGRAHRVQRRRAPSWSGCCARRSGDFEPRLLQELGQGAARRRRSDDEPQRAARSTSRPSCGRSRCRCGCSSDRDRSRERQACSVDASTGRSG